MGQASRTWLMIAGVYGVFLIANNLVGSEWESPLLAGMLLGQVNLIGMLAALVDVPLLLRLPMAILLILMLGVPAMQGSVDRPVVVEDTQMSLLLAFAAQIVWQTPLWILAHQQRWSIRLPGFERNPARQYYLQQLIGVVTLAAVIFGTARYWYPAIGRAYGFALLDSNILPLVVVLTLSTAVVSAVGFWGVFGTSEGCGLALLLACGSVALSALFAIGVVTHFGSDTFTATIVCAVGVFQLNVGNAVTICLGLAVLEDEGLRLTCDGKYV